MLAILMVAVLSVGFVSCGDDDDAPRSANQLIGTWMMVYQYRAFYEKSNGNWVLTEEYEGSAPRGEDSCGLMFQPGGIVSVLRDVLPDGRYGWVLIEYGYKLQNGHLYLRHLDEADTDGWNEYAKISISGDTFELTKEWFWDTPEGACYEKSVTKDIYKKVK